MRVRVKWYVVTYLYCTYKFKDKILWYRYV